MRQSDHTSYIEGTSTAWSLVLQLIVLIGMTALNVQLAFLKASVSTSINDLPLEEEIETPDALPVDASLVATSSR